MVNMFVIRLAIVAAVVLLGAKEGGFGGAICAFTVFGIFSILFYTACDAWGALKEGMSRPRITHQDHSQNLHVHTGQSMPGEPTEREWAALIEVGRRQIERPKGISNGY
jgi:hypothetical protein